MFKYKQSLKNLAFVLLLQLRTTLFFTYLLIYGVLQKE